MGSGDKNVYAINPDGTLKWFFGTGDKVDSSPAIGADGTIYLGSDDNHLYALSGSSGGLARTSWPMFHRDIRHTGFSSALPVPDIKANGHDGSITVPRNSVVSITISLKPGSFTGQNAVWYVVEKTPSGAFNHFDLKTLSMVPGLLPTYQGPLFDLGSIEVLNTSDLTAGTHIFCFGLNLTIAGSSTADSLYYDQVSVSVSDNM